MANRIETAIKNVQNIPQIHPVDEYPTIPLYSDRDGLWYLYTIWHIEQATKIMGV